jgi:DNA-binding transcriptional LysR family regulator
MARDNRWSVLEGQHVAQLGDIICQSRQGKLGCRHVVAIRLQALDNLKLDHGVDDMAMAISLVASTRGLALMPAYAKNLLPGSVVSRPLEGEAPTIDLAVGYSKSNTSPILKLFASRLDELVRPKQKH